jgi:hypothetical protein
MKNRTRHYYEGMARLSEKQIIYSSNSHDGYTREAAIIWLSELNQIRFIPIFLVRANDWVVDISVLAKKAILNLLTAENIQDIIQYIPNIFHLEKCQRHSHKQFLEEVRKFLTQPEFQRHLLIAISSKNIALATLAFELFSETNRLSMKDNILLGLKSKGIIIAKQSFNLTNQLSDKDFLEIKDSLVNHRSSYVASRALKRIVKINPSLIDNQLTALLFHRSTDIRLIAQNRCLEKGIYADKIYLDALLSEIGMASKKSIAIQGVCEVQKQKCLPMIRELLHTTDDNQIYKASIDVIAKLLMEDAKPEITSGLLAKSLTQDTLKLVLKICRKHYISYSWSELLEINRGLNNDMDFLFKLSLIGSKWNSLIFYLKLLTECKVNSETITTFLRSWSCRFSKQHLNPTSNQKIEINKLFNSALPGVPHDLQNHIQFLTKSFL